jgi:hypothetical protein
VYNPSVYSQPVEKIQFDMKRDYYLTSAEAAAYGVVDMVLTPPQVGSLLAALCSLLSALCSLLSALCSLLSALCSLPSTDVPLTLPHPHPTPLSQPPHTHTLSPSR